jgi:hypothetical protein
VGGPLPHHWAAGPADSASSPSAVTYARPRTSRSRSSTTSAPAPLSTPRPDGSCSATPPRRGSTSISARTPAHAQVEVVAAGLPPDWAATVWLMHGCGLRIGEALAVNLRCRINRGKTLRVKEQVDPSAHLRPLKLRRAGEFRDIPLPEHVSEAIDKHGTTPGGYLFQGRKYKLVVRRSYQEDFQRGELVSCGDCLRATPARENWRFTAPIRSALKPLFSWRGRPKRRIVTKSYKIGEIGEQDERVETLRSSRLGQDGDGCRNASYHHGRRERCRRAGF